MFNNLSSVNAFHLHLMYFNFVMTFVALIGLIVKLVNTQQKLCKIIFFAMYKHFEILFLKSIMYFIISISTVIQVPLCNNTSKTIVNFSGYFVSQSQFFVVTGVLSFCFCLLSCVVYFLFNEKLLENDKLLIAVSPLCFGI